VRGVIKPGTQNEPIEKFAKCKLKNIRKIIDLERHKLVLSTGNGLGKPTRKIKLKKLVDPIGSYLLFFKGSY
jgi:hypothetical protein